MSSSTSTETTVSEPTAGTSRARWGTQLVVLAVIVLVAGGLLVRNVTGGSRGAGSHKMPQSAAMEDKLGIRFSRVAVVGDGGLITVTYVVLDSEKASRFQTDVTHPPVLSSEQRKGSTSRVSLMRQGHTLRAGQQYYLVYQNPADLVRHNEKVEITYGSLVLKHVPVW
jgi:hypothetical protein